MEIVAKVLAMGQIVITQIARQHQAQPQLKIHRRRYHLVKSEAVHRPLQIR